MRIFISGGCKNGKSYYSQRLAHSQREGDNRLFYIATMIPTDGEDDERIARHIRERDGFGFSTLEQPVNIEGVLDKSCPNDSLMLDSLTALLANEMFPLDGPINENAANKIIAGLDSVIENRKNIVIVSDYIYGDAARYDDLTELYRKSLATLDRFAASLCDIVLEAVFTNIIVHKGREAALLD